MLCAVVIYQRNVLTSTLKTQWKLVLEQKNVPKVDLLSFSSAFSKSSYLLYLPHVMTGIKKGSNKCSPLVVILGHPTHCSPCLAQVQFFNSSLTILHQVILFLPNFRLPSGVHWSAVLVWEPLSFSDDMPFPFSYYKNCGYRYIIFAALF